MAFKMSMTDIQGNVYPDAVWIVKFAGFDDYTPGARCVLRCYKNQATHDAAPHDPLKPLQGTLTVTGTEFTTPGERSYSVSGAAYQYMRAQALDAPNTGFDIIAASYEVALATKDVGTPPVGDAEDTRTSFFAIPGHEAVVV